MDAEYERRDDLYEAGLVAPPHTMAYHLWTALGITCAICGNRQPIGAPAVEARREKELRRAQNWEVASDVCVWTNLLPIGPRIKGFVSPASRIGTTVVQPARAEAFEAFVGTLGVGHVEAPDGYMAEGRWPGRFRSADRPHDHDAVGVGEES